MPVGAPWVGTDSIDQSCGTRTPRHSPPSRRNSHAPSSDAVSVAAEQDPENARGNAIAPHAANVNRTYFAFRVPLIILKITGECHRPIVLLFRAVRPRTVKKYC